MNAPRLFHTRPSFFIFLRAASAALLRPWCLPIEQNLSSNPCAGSSAVHPPFPDLWASYEISLSFLFERLCQWWDFSLLGDLLWNLDPSDSQLEFMNLIRLSEFLGLWLLSLALPILTPFQGFIPGFSLTYIKSLSRVRSASLSLSLLYLDFYLLSIYILKRTLGVSINWMDPSFLCNPKLSLAFFKRCLPVSWLKESVYSNKFLSFVFAGGCSMDLKGKSFAETVCAEPPSSMKLLKSDDGEPSRKPAGPVLDGSVGTSKGKIADVNLLDSYLSKLAKVRTNFQKFKESCLMGRIFGDPIDFPKIRNKLLFDWKYVKGEVTLIPKGNYWFEISFANPLDKKSVWDRRPFHVLGQLVILKQWKPNFNTLTESVTELDLWVRIPLLPAEFSNKEAIQTIIEENNVGKFIRLDPYSMNGKIGSYMRICINIDVNESLTINDVVSIPDENNDLKGYPIWFEDFSKGCGHCGEKDHFFDGCPLRTMKTKKVRINFKRSKKKFSTGGNGDDVEGVWCKPGKPETNLGGNTFATGGFRPYLSGRGGITINFKSFVSQGSSNTSLKNSKASSNEHVTPFDAPYDAPILVKVSEIPLNKGVVLMEDDAVLAYPNDESKLEDVVVPDTAPVFPLAVNENDVVEALVNDGVDNNLSPSELFENDMDNNQAIAEFMVTGDLTVEEEEDEYFSEHSF